MQILDDICGCTLEEFAAGLLIQDLVCEVRKSLKPYPPHTGTLHKSLKGYIQIYRALNYYGIYDRVNRGRVSSNTMA